jgi:hypothetical protein
MDGWPIFRRLNKFFATVRAMEMNEHEHVVALGFHCASYLIPLI